MFIITHSRVYRFTCVTDGRYHTQLALAYLDDVDQARLKLKKAVTTDGDVAGAATLVQRQCKRLQRLLRLSDS
jgi:Tfp pilus assembly protein PilF